MTTDKTRATHDLGGDSRFMCERIDREPHHLTDFDRMVDAMEGLLVARSLLTVDELRRGIEALGETDYHRLSYYQRWLVSVTATLLRRGTITEAELTARLAVEGA